MASVTPSSSRPTSPTRSTTAASPPSRRFLQAGSNNLGFVALRTCDTSLRMLRWWQARLYDQCVVRIEDGLFVDQKWMDLAPGLFGGEHNDGGVTVHVDPGYNVAYWNLHGRSLTQSIRRSDRLRRRQETQ